MCDPSPNRSFPPVRRVQTAGLRVLTIAASTLLVAVPAPAVAAVSEPVEPVSVTEIGGGGRGDSLGQRVSADGTRIAFTSTAPDLIPGVTDTNGGADVFVRDLTAGTTTLVSSTPGGTTTGSGPSFFPVISADGATVVFQSFAGDLVVGVTDTNGGEDVFVRDMTAAATTVASATPGGASTGNGISGIPVLSADGTTVGFASFASDLIAAATDANGASDVFIRNITTATTSLVSANPSGTATGNDLSFAPAISADGTTVAFYSAATDLAPGVTDTNHADDVFVRHITTAKTSLVSANPSGTATGNGSSFEPVISADGTTVAFYSAATDLASGVTDTNRAEDVFVRHITTATTRLVSANPSGTATGNGVSGVPVISADGATVAFTSFASNLVAAATDANGASDVFVRDMAGGTTRAVSVNPAGTTTGDRLSFGPAISSDGVTIAFASGATDLVEPALTLATGAGYFQVYAFRPTADHPPVADDGA